LTPCAAIFFRLLASQSKRTRYIVYTKYDQDQHYLRRARSLRVLEALSDAPAALPNAQTRRSLQTTAP
jgi:hypothetical protein